jgi:Holliday junction DNA helicase RuvB
MRIKERSILFIDEIHRMTNLVEEFLYPVMEDFKLDMSVEAKKADEGTVISIPIPKFTIVGATTEPGSLSAPFRDRFKLKFTLELYDVDTLSRLIEINCSKLNVSLTDGAIKALAGASRGTPRIANGLLEWIRDYGIAKGLQIVSEADLRASLAMKQIGPDGSTKNDRRYYDFLKKQRCAVGLSTIGSSLNIDKDTIVNVIEPFLLQQGKISKTTKGRIAR